jgi:hypothetical protein
MGPHGLTKLFSRRAGRRCPKLLASVQRLTGVGVWAYDVPTAETWWSEQAKRVHDIDPARRTTLEAVVDRYTETDRTTVMDLVDRAIDDCEPFRVDVGLTEGGTTQRKNILELETSTVRLVDGDGEVLRTVGATEECVERAGEHPDYPDDEQHPAARVYRTGEPEVYADVDASGDDRDRGELVRGISVPVGEHGVLSAGDVVRDAFDERDVEAAGLLGQLGAEAITRIGWAKRSRAV